MARKLKRFSIITLIVVVSALFIFLVREEVVRSRSDVDLLKLEYVVPEDQALWNEEAIARVQKTVAGRDEYRFAVAGDSHENYDTFLRIAALAEEKGADFFMHTGDFTHWGRVHEFTRMFDAVEDVAMPIVFVPGNHDIKHVGYEVFTRLVGPLDFRFAIGSLDFLCVNSARLEMEPRISTMPGGGGDREASIRELEGFDAEDVARIEAAIQAAERTLLFTHLPPAVGDFAGHAFDRGVTAFEEMLLRNPGKVAAIFCGHIHCFGEATFGGTDLVVCGGGGGKIHRNEALLQKHHFVLVTVKGKSITRELVLLDEGES